MGNFLAPMQKNYANARRELESVLDILEESVDNSLVPLQSLTVTDEMAEIFREKPVILIQNMNINIIQIGLKIQRILRLFDKIDMTTYREALLRANGKKKTRKEDASSV